jgi:hypothetical protein
MIEKTISNFISSQFPEVYRETGETFVLFTQKYYEWLEQSNNALYHSRRIADYRDVDLTVDDYVIFLKEQYLKNIQLDTAEKTRQLIKHSLDLYRSKGSDQSVDLFFRSIYGKPASTSYPGQQIFKTSHGKWEQPVYLEVTPSIWNSQFVNKQVTGINSKATAFVERYTRKEVNGKTVNLLFISAINGTFQTNELLTLQGQNLKDIPTIIGSMTDINIIAGGSGFSIGDILTVISDNGVRGQAIVSNTLSLSGAISFNIADSGWGYTTNSQIIISDHILSLTNVTSTDTSYFQTFENFQQPIAVINVISANTTLNVQIGDTMSTFWANNSLAGRGYVANVTNQVGANATITVNEISGNLNFTESLNANIAGNVFVSSTDYVLPGVSITNSSNAIVGNGTFYSANISIGDQVKLLYYDTNNLLLGIEEKIVSTITDNTHLTTSSITSFPSNNVIMQLSASKKVIGTGTTFTGFAYGDRVGIYSNTTFASNYTVSRVVNNTLLYLQEQVSFSNNATKISTLTLGKNIYFNSNTIVANIATYTNMYVQSRVMGVQGTTNLYFSNTFFAIANGASLTQKDANNTQVATATIKTTVNVGTGAVKLIVNNIAGAFSNSRSTYINNVAVTSSFQYAEMSLGVSNTLNQYLTFSNNMFFAGNTTGMITRLSQGSLASFSVSNNITFPEAVTVYTDLTGPYFNIPLTATQYGFPANPTANLTSNLYNLFTTANEIYGGIGQLVNINPGINYDVAPMIMVRSDLVSSAIYGRELFNITLDGLFFTVGELVTQNNGATGIVYSSNSTVLNARRITYEQAFTVGQKLYGVASGASANLIGIADDLTSTYLGNNTIISANVQNAMGSIANVMIFDSGWGYLNEEDVFLQKANSDIIAEGSAVLKKQGSAAGFYLNHDGFLSDKDKLYDGFYYQDFSYVVKTSLSFDKYAEMLKNIIHVAGTQVFYEIAFETFIIDTTTNIHTEIVNA